MPSMASLALVEKRLLTGMQARALTACLPIRLTVAEVSGRAQLHYLLMRRRRQGGRLPILRAHLRTNAGSFTARHTSSRSVPKPKIARVVAARKLGCVSS